MNAKNSGSPLSTVSIYALGGTGVNIVRAFEKTLDDLPLIKDLVQIHYIDTGKGNWKNGVPDNATIVGSGKGSGGNPQANIAAMRSEVPGILQKAPFGDFVIAVGSSSGGTSPAATFVLADQALEQGKTPIVFGVASYESTNRIENSSRYLASLKNLSSRHQKNVVLNMRHNNRPVLNEGEFSMTQGQVDINMVANLTTLSLLLSCRAGKLDYSDLANFLEPNNVIKDPIAPDVMALEMFEGDIKLREGEMLVSVASLARTDMAVTYNESPLYQVTGILEDQLGQVVNNERPVHWTTLAGALSVDQDRMNQALKESKSRVKAYRPAQLETAAFGGDDDGFAG